MNDTFRQRIRAFVYGAAVGDALGLGAELLTRDELKFYYPDGLREYSQIIRDAHRAVYPRGSLTCDFDVMTMMIDSVASSPTSDYMDFARRLKDWYNNHPVDVLSHMRWVLSQPDYLDDPIKVCRRVWRSMRRFEAGNDAMTRAAIIGMMPGERMEDARNNCRLTHADTRCLACSALIAETTRRLVYDGEIISYDDASDILRIDDDSTIPYLDIALNGTLDDFDLDDEDTYWYTRKTMGVAMWSLWHDKRPYEALTEIIDHGGDADTSASLSVALSCIRYGMDDIPATLTEGLLEKERVARTADILADAVSFACKASETTNTYNQ